MTKQSQEIEAWQSKMEIMKRENGKALKENSLLHMELIKKDEACDERLRAAAAEQRKLEDQIAELHFWKQQQIERHLELEKNHEGVKQKLNDVITGSYAFSKVPGEDIKARMELTEALKEAVAGGPAPRGCSLAPSSSSPSPTNAPRRSSADSSRLRRRCSACSPRWTPRRVPSSRARERCVASTVCSTTPSTSTPWP